LRGGGDAPTPHGWRGEEVVLGKVGGRVERGRGGPGEFRGDAGEGEDVDGGAASGLGAGVFGEDGEAERHAGGVVSRGEAGAALGDAFQGGEDAVDLAGFGPVDEGLDSQAVCGRDVGEFGRRVEEVAEDGAGGVGEAAVHGGEVAGELVGGEWRPRVGGGGERSGCVVHTDTVPPGGVSAIVRLMECGYDRDLAPKAVTVDRWERFHRGVARGE